MDFQVNMASVVYSVVRKPQSCTPAGDHGHPPACARGAFCIVWNGTVAMFAWKLKCTLSGDRLDFQVSMDSLISWTSFGTSHGARARASARDGFCVVHNSNVATLAWILKCSLSGDRLDFQVNMGPLRTRLLPQRTKRRCACARARARVRALYCPQ